MLVAAEVTRLIFSPAWPAKIAEVCLLLYIGLRENGDEEHLIDSRPAGLGGKKGGYGV